MIYHEAMKKYLNEGSMTTENRLLRDCSDSPIPHSRWRKKQKTPITIIAAISIVLLATNLALVLELG